MWEYASQMLFFIGSSSSILELFAYVNTFLLGTDIATRCQRELDLLRTAEPRSFN